MIEWTYLSSNFANTYYGVRPEEALVGRPAYNPGASGMLSGGIMVFRTRERISWVAGYVLSRLQNELTRSPIISERVETRTILSVMWNFK